MGDIGSNCWYCLPDLQLPVQLVARYAHTKSFLTTTEPSYLYLLSVQPHRSTHSSHIVPLSRPPSLPLKVNNCSFHHPVSGICFPRNSTCLDMSVHHFLYRHCHHPLLFLSSTPGTKLLSSTNPFLHSSTFTRTRLTPWTLAVFFLFFSGMSVLTLALCAKLASSQASFWVIVIIIIMIKFCNLGLLSNTMQNFGNCTKRSAVFANFLLCFCRYSRNSASGPIFNLKFEILTGRVLFD